MPRRKPKDEVMVLSTKPPPMEAPVAGLDTIEGTEPDEDFTTQLTQIPLWSAKWSKESLEAKRADMGAREFDRGFRQRPLSETDLLFPPGTVERCLDRAVSLPDHITQGDWWHKLHRDAGVDLAISAVSKQNAYFCLVGVATTKDWHRWICTMYFTRGLGFGQQCGALIEYQDRFQFEVVTVENNAYQESLVRYFQEEGMMGRVPVRGYTTGALTKRDMDVGLPGMAVEFEQGRWHIPYGDARSRRIMDPLVEELRSYPSPGVHDDAIMACFLARESRRVAVRPKAKILMLRW